MPRKKPLQFHARIDSVPPNRIYININHLESGEYELRIIHKNKLVSSTTFKKR